MHLSFFSIQIAEDVKHILTKAAERYAVRFAAILKPITADQSRRGRGQAQAKKAEAPVFAGAGKAGVVLGIDTAIRVGAFEVQVNDWGPND
jgi:hypothetical protein